MAICPHCQTQLTNLLEPCPTGDGYYSVEEKVYRENPDDPLLGWPVAGRFVVNGLVGRGTMAKVYRAHQLGVERDVALKLFSRESLIEKNLPRSDREAAIQMAKDRFVQEAKVLAKLQHPNCVTLYDFGALAQDDYLFIAMELIQGVSLRTAANRRLKYEPILEIAQQVLLALREAHGVGIVHRDLKPENIILSVRPGGDEQVVKVVDFGIARMIGASVDGQTMVGTLFGTPAYMSPEQCRGDTSEVGPHSDIYSLGCILYELLCGKLPFSANSPQEMIHKHIHEEAPDVIVRAGIRAPIEFVDFIARCLKKDPAQRFKDAQEALVALNELSISETSTAEHMRRTAVQGSSLKSVKVMGPKDMVRGDVLDAPRLNAIPEIEPSPMVTNVVKQQSSAGSGSVLQTQADVSISPTKPKRQFSTMTLVMAGMVIIALICVMVLVLVFSQIA